MPASPPRAEREAESRIPLKSIDFLILLMLAKSGDRHGYGIMQDVAEHSENKLELEAGSLYRTIRRMQDENLVEESSRRPAADLDDERRRYYRLTPFGRRVVAAEAARLRRLVRIAESARLLAPQGAR
jgi:DNA-binding PadR family transcriptional regulator